MTLRISLDGLILTIPSTPRPVSRSLAYFCPRCGRIWARAERSDATSWDMTYRPCRTCRDTHLYWMIDPLYQGCISSYPNGEKDLLPTSQWPRDLLMYELLTTLDNYGSTLPQTDHHNPHHDAGGSGVAQEQTPKSHHPA